jgi:MFS superfamily sulfate permease-like transporter
LSLQGRLARFASRLPYYLPILRWGPAYSKHNLITDSIAGLTLGIINVGSAIVVAGVAGRPVPNGFLSNIFPCMFYCLFASSMYTPRNQTHS